MCVVKLGSFHGCFFCKVNQRGCSLCPKAANDKGEMVNLRRKNWCWYLTLVHHIASILDMEDPEGPVHVLPSYDGVDFPMFDKSLAGLIKKFKTPMSDSEIKIKWKELRQTPLESYYGVPHKKLLSLEHRKIRGRFLIIGTRREVEHKLCDILRNAQQGKLARLWAVGTRTYGHVRMRTRGPVTRQKAGSRLVDNRQHQVELLKEANRQVASTTRVKTKRIVNQAMLKVCHHDSFLVWEYVHRH